MDVPLPYILDKNNNNCLLHRAYAILLLQIFVVYLTLMSVRSSWGKSAFINNWLDMSPKDI